MEISLPLKVLQEVEKYRNLKADIRNQAKAKVKQITKEQREELLEQGRKEGKEECQCHLKYETPPPYSMWFYGKTMKINP